MEGRHLAIEAMAHLPGWRLQVLGDGADRARLQALAERRGVADRVDFLGWLDRAAVLEHMRAADVFLFPSLHDEGGWVVGEAMALGLPVVTMDRGGPAAMGGAVVPVGSIAEVARGLAAAVERTAERPPRPRRTSRVAGPSCSTCSSPAAWSRAPAPTRVRPWTRRPPPSRPRDGRGPPPNPRHRLRVHARRRVGARDRLGLGEDPRRASATCGS